MAAVIFALNLRILINTLTRSPGRAVGLIVLTLIGLIITALTVSGVRLIGDGDPRVTGAVLTVSLVTTVVFWLIGSLTFFGLGDEVDASRLALFPVRARTLLPGLAASDILTPLGIFGLANTVAFVALWSSLGPLNGIAAAVGAVVGLPSAVVLIRAVTTTFTAFLTSRRFRDLAAIAMALVLGVITAAGLIIQSVAQLGLDAIVQRLGAVATIVGWTPVGWAWSLPSAVAAGAWPIAGLKIALAVGFLGGLLLWWTHQLRLALTRQGGASAGGRVKSRSLADLLTPATPAGAVAARSLRGWRRDPRYLVVLVTATVLPVVVAASLIGLVGPEIGPFSVATAVVMAAWLFGSAMVSDVAHDGSALALHVLSGVRGRDDRLGRAIAYLWIGAPVIAIMVTAGVVIGGSWQLIPALLAAAVAPLLSALGSGLALGSIWVGVAPPPHNPFGKGSGGALILGLTLLIGAVMAVLSLPAWILILVGSPWLALAVAVLIGGGCLYGGIAFGGRRLDRHWPELLASARESW